MLLNPIFDVHLRKINRLKVSAFAAHPKAKRILSEFFKSNDFVYTFNEPQLQEIVDFCSKNNLTIHIADNLRSRDERFEAD
jgi:hypothetical protein